MSAGEYIFLPVITKDLLVYRLILKTAKAQFLITSHTEEGVPGGGT